MIKSSTYYSIVCKATGLITEKGSKKAMLKVMKANPGVYFLALTSRPIGAILNNVFFFPASKEYFSAE